MIPQFLAWMGLIAQAAGEQVAKGQGVPKAFGWGFIVWFVLLFAVMYYVMVRPQKKKEKQRQVMLDALKKGDRVVTAGGIYGVVKNLKEDEVTLVVDEQRDIRLRMTRSAVSAVVQAAKDKGGEKDS